MDNAKDRIEVLAAEVIDFLRGRNLPIWEVKSILRTAEAVVEDEKLK